MGGNSRALPAFGYQAAHARSSQFEKAHWSLRIYGELIRAPSL
jgi:hypothetical protein